MIAAAPVRSACCASAVARVLPASLTWATIGTLARSTANSTTACFSLSVRLTDSATCSGTASASAPWRRWKSMTLPSRSKSMRCSRVNGIAGACTRPRRKAVIGESLGGRRSPAVRLAVEDAELLELAANIRLALLGGGRQRRSGRADVAAHHHHAALERGGILVAEEQPQPGQLVLQVARALPVARHAGLEGGVAQVGADRPGCRIGADAAERHRRQQIFHAGQHGEVRPQFERGPGDFEELLAVEARLLDADEIRQPLDQARH